MVTEPRTKTGRRLIREWPATLSLRDVILAIEAEAAAGPRDEAIELCPECGGQYSDLAGHRRFAHNVPGWRNESVEAWDKASAATREAAAGPRDPDVLICGQCGDALMLAEIVGHLYSEGRFIPQVEALAGELTALEVVLAKASE